MCRLCEGPVEDADKTFLLVTNLAHTAQIPAARLASLRRMGLFGTPTIRKLTGGSIGRSRRQQSVRQLYAASKHLPEQYLGSSQPKKIWLSPRPPLNPLLNYSRWSTVARQAVEQIYGEASHQTHLELHRRLMENIRRESTYTTLPLQWRPPSWGNDSTQ
jgi:hypothetical protein